MIVYFFCSGLLFSGFSFGWFFFDFVIIIILVFVFFGFFDVESDFAEAVLVVEFVGDGFDDDIVFVDGGVADGLVVEAEDGVFFVGEYEFVIMFFELELAIVESFVRHGA